MEQYKNNASGIAEQDIGIWPQPHYWWEGGAAWGGMIEYSMFTGDQSHVKTLQQALVANYGPENDFILEHRRSQTVRRCAIRSTKEMLMCHSRETMTKLSGRSPSCLLLSTSSRTPRTLL